jgi:xanthine dehydrogenase accessory factor
MPPGEKMRKIAELIVLVRGGGENGSAIAHRLYHSHFRVCITEIAAPLAVNRGACFSEAVYDSQKTVEDVTAERALPSLEQIYKVWRGDKIPVLVDPDLTVRALLKPDVIVNAMMLKRKTSSAMDDAALVIGIGPGFTAGEDVHMVIESAENNNLGKVIIEGSAVETVEKPAAGCAPELAVQSADAGVFKTEKNIGDVVLAGDVVGQFNEESLKAPVSGVLRGLLRNESKVLANTALFEIDPVNDKSVCFNIRDKKRAVAGGVLEAILMSLNLAEGT